MSSGWSSFGIGVLPRWHYYSKNSICPRGIICRAHEAGKVALAVDLKWRIDEDPAGATLRGLLKRSALALRHCPLIWAVPERDMEVIGKPAHSEYSNAAYAEQLVGFTPTSNFCAATIWCVLI